MDASDESGHLGADAPRCRGLSDRDKSVLMPGSCKPEARTFGHVFSLVICGSPKA